jgi:hypothetical protein
MPVSGISLVPRAHQGHQMAETGRFTIGNWSDGRPSVRVSVGQLEADGQLLVEQVNRAFDLPVRQMAPSLGDPKTGQHLLGTACGDAPQMKAIASSPATTLRQIQRRRIGSSLALVGELGMPLPKNFQKWPKVFDDLKRQIEGDKSRDCS